MEFFVGLDVSVKTTSICVIDAAGTIIREGKAESSPEAISAFLAAADRHYVRVGLEAGPLCQWLYAGLTKAGFPVICIETRHAQAVLCARPTEIAYFRNRVVCAKCGRSEQSDRGAAELERGAGDGHQLAWERRDARRGVNG